ncbi:MAG: 3-oxoacyl-ACP reductase FabG [Deltaproteobacteria bacterium]|nr:3-oxoacyl-ACP reductase FabG [Deltaproteobacteria bacterium]
MKLKDKVCIVTGAGQAIGKYYARRLAEEGAKIVVAEFNAETGKAVVDEMTEKGHDTLFIQTDVSDEKSAQAMADETVEKYGRINILINNASVFATLGFKPFDQIPIEEWDRVMAVNLRGMWLCCKAVVPYMKDQKKGKIINTSSSAWDMGRPLYLHYVTSKAGVVGFTRGLAREVGDWNINVNCVSYAGVITEIERESYTPEAQEWVMSQQCIKKPGIPEELVGTIIFLASEDSDFLSGQNIHPNGGLYFH